jgi:hypothetical protein
LGLALIQNRKRLNLTENASDIWKDILGKDRGATPQEHGDANILANTKVNDVLASVGLAPVGVNTQSAGEGAAQAEQTIREAFASGKMSEVEAIDALSKLQIDLYSVD